MPQMKPFDKSTMLLEMYHDSYFPNLLVDRVKAEMEQVVELLESGERSEEKIQTALDKMTVRINALEKAFEAEDSELETVARDSIAVTIRDILGWFGIDIDAETALRERDW
jgi:hypothetical protein